MDKHGWRRYPDERPPCELWYMVITGEGTCKTWEIFYWQPDEAGIWKHVTHWMPLPPDPEPEPEITIVLPVTWNLINSGDGYSWWLKDEDDKTVVYVRTDIQKDAPTAIKRAWINLWNQVKNAEKIAFEAGRKIERMQQALKD